MLRAATSHSPAIAIPAALLAFSAARISPSLSFRRLSTFGLALAGRAFLHCTLSRRFPLPGMVNLSLMSDRLPVSKGIREENSGRDTLPTFWILQVYYWEQFWLGYMCTLTTFASFSSGSSSEHNREILVQHLLVKEDDQKLLLELQKRIAQGEDLSDLAAEYSICPSKEGGGMLGWVRKGQMVPEFEEAAFGAPINKVVRCKTKFGWHLLQVLSEREESILEHIQPNELYVKLHDPTFMEDAQLVDVREPEEVAKAHLPGFQVLPLRQFGEWGPEITTKFDPQKDTYVLCHHGMRSLQVAKWLQTQGFRKVFNIAGGIHEYAVKADPSIPTY
ncbi:rhodanese-like/PpiC domain-containing protein 12, chloroplastic isoform X2 [Ipomoea triloba]|uniref:rhodanese-like/PpiC domain-containing protein 12, chloroplastic isoform X2 n=1 Tax=Ipomoea triloba TaxID=35885 RepID=UPI00125CF6C6|nr:rhodanese-like/PpiC domain-containing protein 12, chloroplastic isoform X2 [Ipomoea triloba]